MDDPYQNSSQLNLEFPIFRYRALNYLMSILLFASGIIVVLLYAYLGFLAKEFGASILGASYLSLRGILLGVLVLYSAFLLWKLNRHSKMEITSSRKLLRLVGLLLILAGATFLPYILISVVGAVTVVSILTAIAWIIAGCALRKPSRSLLLISTVYLIFSLFGIINITEPVTLIFDFGAILPVVILLYLIFNYFIYPLQINPRNAWKYIAQILLLIILIILTLNYGQSRISAQKEVDTKKQLTSEGYSEVDQEWIHNTDLKPEDYPIAQGFDVSLEPASSTPYDISISSLGMLQLKDSNLSIDAKYANSYNTIKSADNRYVFSGGYVKDGDYLSGFALKYLDLVTKSTGNIAQIKESWGFIEVLGVSPDANQIIFRSMKQANTKSGSLGSAEEYYFVYNFSTKQTSYLTWPYNQEPQREIQEQFIGWDKAGLHFLDYGKMTYTGGVTDLKATIYTIDGKKVSSTKLYDGTLASGLWIKATLLNGAYLVHTSSDLRDYLVTKDGKVTTINTKEIENKTGEYSFNPYNVIYDQQHAKVYYFFNRGKSVFYRNISDGKEVELKYPGTGNIRIMAGLFENNSKLIISGDDKVFRLYDVVTGKYSVLSEIKD